MLVGTTSIETSELLSSILKKRKIKHEVLNAKQHEREAHIVQQAGRPGAITIATNMAGRGTDIVLGGNLEAELAADRRRRRSKDAIRADWQKRHEAVLEAGGLHIVGTERHESRRIDNQLRGRSGRQGDPGLEPLLPVDGRQPDAHLRRSPSAPRRCCRAPACAKAKPSRASC